MQATAFAGSSAPPGPFPQIRAGQNNFSTPSSSPSGGCFGVADLDSDGRARIGKRHQCARPAAVFLIIAWALPRAVTAQTQVEVAQKRIRRRPTCGYLRL